MPEIDEGFLESLERDLGERKKSAQVRKRLLVAGVVSVVLAVVGAGVGFLILGSKETRTLPPPPPPPSPQPTLPVSEKAKETGKGYYIEHTEIQSALAEYARQILRGELKIESLGSIFQPVSEMSWDKWYFDTVAVREGFKTRKQPQPAAHPFTEEHLITYTVQPDDRWGAWGVGVKYAAALGIDITNPADKETASLVAAYVWLQSENRLLYDKSNYFDDKGEFDPKRPKKDINLLHAGDEIRFTHLSPEALKELAQRPEKFLQATGEPAASPVIPTAEAPVSSTPPPPAGEPGTTP